MIRRLKWDSEFFGYEVGVVKLCRTSSYTADIFLKEAQNYDLVYVMSSNEVLCPHLTLVDQKLIFSKKLSQDTELSYNPTIRKFNNDSYKELLELCYTSGQFSRFKKDENFKNQEFERLYKIWLDQCLDPETSSEVLIKETNHCIAGFVTVEMIKENIFRIGLIAVNPIYQRQGIAKELISAAEEMIKKRRGEVLEVATQKANEPAARLYARLNFEIKSFLNIYHYWKR